MVRIKVIVGSTRPNRFGPQIAWWFMERAAQYKNKDIVFELVDLAAFNLPLLDEPELPSKGNYANPHTLQWAATVKEADAFVFVHPEYNHAVSAALKNAIDYLWAEWNYKPVAFVGYGGEVGGARATEQLRAIAGQMKMFDIREQVLVASYRQHVDEHGRFIPSAHLDAVADGLVKELVFWAQHIKPLRELRQA